MAGINNVSLLTLLDLSGCLQSVWTLRRLGLAQLGTCLEYYGYMNTILTAIWTILHVVHYTITVP